MIESNLANWMDADAESMSWIYSAKMEEQCSFFLSECVHETGVKPEGRKTGP